MRKWVLPFVMVPAVLVPARALAISNGVVVEATEDYTLPGCNSPLSRTIDMVEGFADGMSEGNTWFIDEEHFYVDGNAWDRDQYDSDLVAEGLDDEFFDAAGTAISFYSGHGTCNKNPSSAQACTDHDDCTNPHPGAGRGFCQEFPTNFTFSDGSACSTGRCCTYEKPKRTIVCGNFDEFGHDIFYGGGDVAFGEGFGGDWSGAGINGGVKRCRRKRRSQRGRGVARSVGEQWEWHGPWRRNSERR